MQNLTDAQKADMKTKMDAVKTALDSGDYNAWVTAVKAMDANSPILQKVTADNFKDYVAQNKTKEADMAAQKTKMEAVKTALDSGDYSAWVTAVKAMDANSPLLTKITSDNFSQYVQANQLRQQADTILKTLGVDQGEMGGPGGMHGGRPGDMSGGMSGGAPTDSSTSNSSTTQN